METLWSIVVISRGWPYIFYAVWSFPHLMESISFYWERVGYKGTAGLHMPVWTIYTEQTVFQIVLNLACFWLFKKWFCKQATSGTFIITISSIFILQADMQALALEINGLTISITFTDKITSAKRTVKSPNQKSSHKGKSYLEKPNTFPSRLFF